MIVCFLTDTLTVLPLRPMYFLSMTLSNELTFVRVTDTYYEISKLSILEIKSPLLSLKGYHRPMSSELKFVHLKFGLKWPICGCQQLYTSEEPSSAFVGS